ncbi:hypothetical protein T03_12056 [Trichinella britovi]|uniref:Uncharacterized protein n=1 Tax=Trichinella britovi TaxID=45882 RepID=A0A0V1D2H3_TRIBR|nr:hypothetical protein T03_12056 [Trichinella britovi]KRY55711.1 hypothetical protein T03_12056 [Trichinella britovi]
MQTIRKKPLTARKRTRQDKTKEIQMMRKRKSINSDNTRQSEDSRKLYKRRQEKQAVTFRDQFC